MISQPVIAFEALPPTTPARVELEVVWRDQRNAESELLVPSLVRQFVLLGKSGGLAGPTNAPSDSMVEVSEEVVDDRAGRWTFNMSGVHPGAAATLYNVVAFSHALIRPLEYARIRSGLPHGRRLPAPITGRSAVVPFETDVALDSDDVQICAEFRQPPDETEAARIRAILIAWCDITAAGGFETDLSDVTKVLLDLMEYPDWLNTEVWVHLADASFDESALDALVNALCGVHVRFKPIVRVEVQ
jgi:hypothetical protein